MRTALLLVAASLAHATTPTQAELDAAFQGALNAWGVSSIDGTVEFRMDPLNDCKVSPYTVWATTQVLDTQTTLHFDADDGAEAHDETSHAYTYVVRLNSNCDWHRISLLDTLIHEAGHIMGVPHSENKRSIMYYLITKGQVVTADDLRHVKLVEARADEAESAAESAAGQRARLK